MKYLLLIVFGPIQKRCAFRVNRLIQLI